MVSPFWLGLSLGLIIAIPVVGFAAAKLAARRVRVAEQKARAAERLAELGMLTGGLAHEIKNPLSTIGLNHQLLREDLDQLEKSLVRQGHSAEAVTRISRRFETVEREATRLRHILEDFLRFAGRVKLEREPVDLHQLLEELSDFFAPQAAEGGVRIRGDMGREPLVLAVDKDLFKQAVLNLMINAVQVMREARGDGRAHGGGNELILRTHPTRDTVRVHVIDTGPGIDAEQLPRIFQPYFSGRKGGTGLGLPTTRRIIEEHGGTIRVHSEVGRGSDFVIELPRTG